MHIGSIATLKKITSFEVHKATELPETSRVFSMG